MSNWLSKIPDEEIKKMLVKYTFDELWKIAQEAYPDTPITKKQFEDEIKKIQENKL